MHAKLLCKAAAGAAAACRSRHQLCMQECGDVLAEAVDGHALEAPAGAHSATRQAG